MNSDSAFAAWILDSLSSGIVAIDGTGTIVLLNRGAQRMLGCGDDAIGADCREILARQPAVARLLLDTLAGRGPLSRAELVLEGTAGRPESTIGFTLCPVRGDDDGVRGAAILFRDLTPFERMDEQDRLRERLAALGQMAAGMAHEIRNPLAGMEVMAGLLRRRLADRPDALSLVTQLTGELRRVAQTVTASLDFVRPAALDHTPVAATRLLDDALSMALARLPFEGSIERDYEPDLPPLLADEDQLRAVFADLVVNALEALESAPDPPKSHLLLRLRGQRVEGPSRSVRVGADGRATAPPEPNARDLVFEVCDDGPGIPPELREKVFYPFFTTKQDGSGVGLANAQKVVASHGGHVELDDRDGCGAIVRVRIPLREARS